MKRLLWLVCCLAICAVAVGSAHARDYYLSPSGSDSNPGTHETPWQTIAKVNTTDLEPGDRVLFQGGQAFVGTITLDTKDSGSASEKVTFSSYGDGRATIDAGNGSALVTKGCSHLAVTDLDFAGSGRNAGNTASGVDILVGEGIELDQLDISGFRGTGLLLRTVADARITNVHAHDNGAAGISIGSYEPEWSQNIYLGYCVAENNPGDPSNLQSHSGSGIVIGCVRGCVVEYCEAMNNGWDMPAKIPNGPVGIWAWNSDHVTIQHCISHDNKTTAGDGGGFDLAGGVTNSVIQYCLSHSNMGPGILISEYELASPWKNNVIRYNISVNDGYKNNAGCGIGVIGYDERMSDGEIYNNTIYNTKGGGISFAGIPAPRLRFRNNIIMTGKGQMIRGNAGPFRFEGNCYWLLDPEGRITGDYKILAEWAKATGQETADGKLIGLWADPMLTDAGTVPDIKPAGLANLMTYRLEPNSSCVGAGLPIKDNGGRDFRGNMVPTDGKPSIGAYQQ